MTPLIGLSDYTAYIRLHASLTITDMTRFINLAQEKYLYPILCEKTYEDLMTAVAGESTTTAQDNLLAKVKPAVAFRSYQLFIEESSIIETPNGLKQAEDVEGTSAPLTPDRRAEMVQKVKSTAAFFENKLLTFLKINKGTYTDWAESSCYCEDATKANYLQGVKGNKSIKKLTPIRLKYENK